MPSWVGLGSEQQSKYLIFRIRVPAASSVYVRVHNSQHASTEPGPVHVSILHSGNSLRVLQPLVINLIVETLVKSLEDLRQLKGITATYRMTNKPLPVRHSPYVSSVLRPLKAFLDGE